MLYLPTVFFDGLLQTDLAPGQNIQCHPIQQEQGLNIGVNTGHRSPWKQKLVPSKGKGHRRNILSGTSS